MFFGLAICLLGLGLCALVLIVVHTGARLAQSTPIRQRVPRMLGKQALLLACCYCSELLYALTGGTGGVRADCVGQRVVLFVHGWVQFGCTALFMFINVSRVNYIMRQYRLRPAMGRFAKHEERARRDFLSLRGQLSPGIAHNTSDTRSSCGASNWVVVTTSLTATAIGVALSVLSMDTHSYRVVGLLLVAIHMSFVGIFVAQSRGLRGVGGDDRYGVRLELLILISLLVITGGSQLAVAIHGECLYRETSQLLSALRLLSLTIATLGLPYGKAIALCRATGALRQAERDAQRATASARQAERGRSAVSSHRSSDSPPLSPRPARRSAPTVDLVIPSLCGAELRCTSPRCRQPRLASGAHNLCGSPHLATDCANTASFLEFAEAEIGFAHTIAWGVATYATDVLDRISSWTAATTTPYIDTGSPPHVADLQQPVDRATSWRNALLGENNVDGTVRARTTPQKLRWLLGPPHAVPIDHTECRQYSESLSSLYHGVQSLEMRTSCPWRVMHSTLNHVYQIVDSLSTWSAAVGAVPIVSARTTFRLEVLVLLADKIMRAHYAGARVRSSSLGASDLSLESVYERLRVGESEWLSSTLTSTALSSTPSPTLQCEQDTRNKMPWSPDGGRAGEAPPCTRKRTCPAELNDLHSLVGGGAAAELQDTHTERTLARLQAIVETPVEKLPACHCLSRPEKKTADSTDRESYVLGRVRTLMADLSTQQWLTHVRETRDRFMLSSHFEPRGARVQIS